MTHRLFLSTIVLSAFVLLSSGCDKQSATNDVPLCEKIEAEKVLERWRAVSAEVKEGQVCAGPHLEDLLVVEYPPRQKGELVHVQDLTDRWTKIMEKLGFVSKAPWQGVGTSRQAVYTKPGEAKTIYAIRIVANSQQAHLVKAYSVRLHTEKM